MPKGLTGTLTRLIADSEKREAPRTITLPHGLRVTIEATAAKFTLRTWRPGQPPSVTEWCTVFDYLPKAYRPALTPVPVQYTEDGRQLLSATWPAQPRDIPLPMMNEE